MFGVQAASRSSTEDRKPVVSSEETTTGVPPARLIASGYVVQYGASTRTSSPGSHSTENALATACFPPLVTSTWADVTTRPESRSVLSAIAWRSAGIPPVGV